MNTKQRTDTRDLVAVYRGARTSSMHPRAASQSTLAASIPNRGPICLARRAPASPSRISQRVRRGLRVASALCSRIQGAYPCASPESAHPRPPRPPTTSSEVRLHGMQHCRGSRRRSRATRRAHTTTHDHSIDDERVPPRHDDDTPPQQIRDKWAARYPMCVVL